ncbi:GerAB/ArcD/ProY family transporter [Desulfolucanica intricata]|uniref:GerAB/ArcD/ProY family transporter n=1 Tax=Desulfolucanica intricata TaxID=1285191 RepID=UPI00082BB77F|nr:endospore germination permease [Desulfolucanica intricata]
MPEKGKIDGRQAVYLNITMILATAILVIPAITAQHAKQDAWLSSLLAVTLVLPIAWLTVKLSSFFPGKTLIEIFEEILGRWPGKFLGLVYLFWLVHICSYMFREYGDFLEGIFFPQTPLIVFLIITAVIACYTIKQGLEVLARVNQLFLPLVISSLILIVLLATPEMNFNRLLPLLEAEPVNLLKGSLVPLAWFGEITTFAMIIPFLNKPGEAHRIAFISILVVGLIFTFVVMSGVAAFGPGVADMTYPILNVTRVINIANFLERLEPLTIIVWVTGGFVKITFFYYVIVLGFAQWLKLSDYRPLAMPVGVILVSLSIIIGDNLVEIVHFLSSVWPFYSIFTFGAGILLFLLIIAILLKRGGKGYS